MQQKKLRGWMIAAPILFFLLGFILIAVMFWDSIIIRVAPKAVLTSALTETFAKMEERWQGNPLLMLAGALDSEGKQTATVVASTTDELLGDVNYDMTVYTDVSSNRLLAEGVVRTSEMELDLNAYLDSSFMAVSSEDLLKGVYYGITFETFSSDIRQFPLLTFLVPASTIGEWEASVLEIQDMMNRSYKLPEIPEISEDDFQLLLLGILALPSEVAETTLDLDGQLLECHKISYNASGTQVSEFLGTDATVRVAFYLHENVVPKIELDIDTENDTYNFELFLGLDVSQGPFSLKYAQSVGGISKNLRVNVDTRKEENSYSENWNIWHSVNGEGKTLVFSYKWDESNGEMLLTAGSNSPQILNLKKTEDGFCLITEDLLGVIRAFSQDGNVSESRDVISCTMTVSKGGAITVPEYKNLDQWSMEDLITLLGGIGSLIGWNMP